MAWIALAIAAATVMAYLPLFDNDFVNYDDDLYILNNHFIQSGIDGQTIGWAFTTFRGANWFPMTWLSWALDFVLFDHDPAGFHFTSLALHVAAAVLLFLAFTRLSVGVWRSAFVAAVFALHPLHVESVAWAAARKDVLSGFFAMLSLLAYVETVRHGRRWFPLVFVFLALGLMAKPTLVTWPFVLLLLDAWPLRRFSGEGALAPKIRRAVVEKIPLFLLVVGSSVVTVAAQSYWGTVQDLNFLPFGVRFENAVVSYVIYIADAFWPTGLCVFYPHPGHTLSTLQVAGSVALLVLVSAFALQQRRRRPEIAVGWLWYLGVLLPVIGLVQVGQAARADRYTYLPLIGLSLPVIWAVAAVAARGPRFRRAVAALGIAALVGLAAVTHAQVQYWRNSRTLMWRALAVTKRNHVAHINLGVALYRDDENVRAARHLEQALQIAPSSPIAAGVLADVRVATGRAEEAIDLYRRALKREPDSLRWHEGLGNALLDVGRGEDAIQSYRRAIEIKPDAAHLYANLALAYQKLGRLEDSVTSFETALRLNPNLADVHANLGVVLVEAGDDERAREHFERAVELDPELALAHGHLGRLYAKQGDLETGLEHAARAAELDPENAPLQAVHAQLLGQAGRHTEAVAAYESALALGSTDVAAYVGLARERIAAGRAALAISPASIAAEETGRRIPAVLALLAEAQAAAGDLDGAASTADEAADVADEAGSHPLAAAYRERAARYREGLQSDR